MNKAPLRWTYIVLPASFLLLSIIVAGIFYPQLPPEISYHLRQGSPDKTMPLGAFIAWMVVPHVFFTILAVALVRLMLLGVRYAPPGETPIFQLLSLMGNIVALPQIILFVAMLQFFLYNTHNIRIFPLWIIALIVLVLGGVFLVICFTRIIRRFRKKKVPGGQE